MRAVLLPNITRSMDHRSVPLDLGVKRLSPQEVADAYTKLEYVATLYPGFRLWFERKVIPGCLEGSRAAFATLDEKTNEISGIVILKRDLREQKICTLFVHPNHAGRGNGTRLLAEGLRWLENPRPVITVGENRYGLFSRLFEKYDFEFTGEAIGLYRLGEAEYVFNDFSQLHHPECHLSISPPSTSLSVGGANLVPTEDRTRLELTQY